MKDIFLVKVSVTLILIISVCRQQLVAQNWTGNINSDWNNSANWSSWPLNNADILIDPINYLGNKISPVIGSASVFTPRKILMQNGSHLLIQHNLATNDNFDVNGAGTILTINSGSVNIGVSNNGRLLADLNGTIIINNGTITTGKSLAVGSGSFITVNNGNINALQRLLVDLGGQFIFENGTIAVGQRLAMSDGDILNSSLFQMNGGNLTVGTEINFVNELGNYTPTFNLSGGLLTVNGNVVWIGVAPGTGAPQFNVTGGTATINGNIQNFAGSTINMKLKLSDLGTFNFNGSLIESLYATDSIVQYNNGNFLLNTTNTWSNAGVFSAINSQTTFNGATTIQGVGSFSFDDVLVSGTGTLHHVAPFNIDIKGDFINDGNFLSYLNKVTLNGNSPQNIDGASITSFHELFITNISPQGVIVKKPILVTGQ